MVTTTFKKIVSPCWKPATDGENSSRNRDASGRSNGLFWHKDLGQHVSGDFSMAVVQANNLLEDHSQLESGSLSTLEGVPVGTFAGIYDGHGGPDAARFVNDHLFDNFKKHTTEDQEVSAEAITNAFLSTEEEFLALVEKEWMRKPPMASVGTCCLVGVVCNEMLYIANAGDSRAVLGKVNLSDSSVKAVQLSTEHNASQESVREELQSMHPDDPQIVVLKHKVWRVKGLIQVSRSIGDAYLKRSDFNRPPLLPKFRLPDSFEKPIMLAEPAIVMQKIQPEDQFVIFASDGLWDHLSNQEAVDIVYSNPRNGIAKRLVKSALCEAAKKREMRYSDLKKIDRGVRRHFHDDITVIVLFLDSNMMGRSPYLAPSVSVKGAGFLPVACDMDS